MMTHKMNSRLISKLTHALTSEIRKELKSFKFETLNLIGRTFSFKLTVLLLTLRVSLWKKKGQTLIVPRV